MCVAAEIHHFVYGLRYGSVHHGHNEYAKEVKYRGQYYGSTWFHGTGGYAGCYGIGGVCPAIYKYDAKSQDSGKY
jgi:hypothetical protein